MALLKAIPVQPNTKIVNISLGGGSSTTTEGSGLLFKISLTSGQVFNFTKFSFADDVKLYATEIFNMKIKDRKLLQQFATKMKEIDENIWIKRLEFKIKDISDNIIIDDLRYPNEELYLKSNGFKILKLDIDTELQNNRLKNTYINDFDMHIECKKHDSEKHTQFLYYDCILIVVNILLCTY